MAPSVLAAGEVAAAPDCRSAVMARISSWIAEMGNTWAYACAAILMAALVATGIVAYRPHSPTTPTLPIVKRMVPAPVPAPPVVAEKSLEPEAHVPGATPVTERIPRRAFAKSHAPRRPIHDDGRGRAPAPTPDPRILSLSKAQPPAPAPSRQST